MSVRTYNEYDDGPLDRTYESTAGGTAGTIFLWLAWAAAAIFWGFMLTTAAGILGAGDNPAIGEPAGPSLMLGALGVLVVGLALAAVTLRWGRRDRHHEALTEAATAVEYDMVEAAGGDDDIHRGPSERDPLDRDAVRVLDGRLN